MDEDYYILTLAAIARELSREQITQANVFLAAGLPLSWVVKQRKAFRAYLLQNREVEFSFRRKDYHTFLNSVYVYDDKIVFTYNFRNHAETVTLDEIEYVFCSDVNDCPPPVNPRTFTVLGFLLRKNPSDLSDSLGFFLVGFGCNPAPAVLY